MSFRVALLAVALLSTGEIGMAEDRTADEIRIVSFNIRYGTAKDGPNRWELRKEFVFDTIRELNPDLLGTQETLGFQKEQIEGALQGYTSFGVGRNDGGDEGEMTAIFYRTARFTKLEGGHFWLSETPEKIGSRGWDASLPRMASWVKLQDRQRPGRVLWFFNTHFDHRGEEARRESARLLRRKMTELADGAPAIATGDFNASEGSAPYRALFSEQDQGVSLIDTYRNFVPEPRPKEGTFTGFDLAERNEARIDWIACTSHFTVESARIDETNREGTTPSDHLPVIAELSWKSETSD